MSDPLPHAPIAPASASATQPPPGAALAITCRLTAGAGTPPGRVLSACGLDGAVVVRIDLRLAGSEPTLHQWDSVQQNYLASSAPAGAAGTAWVLEATIATALAPPYRTTLASEVRLGIALALLPSGPLNVELQV